MNPLPGKLLPDPSRTPPNGQDPLDTLPMRTPPLASGATTGGGSFGDLVAEVSGSLPDRSAHRMGRYVLQGEIGHGGMGVVYRAWDPELGREVALKVLGSGALASTVDRERFLREARAAARLEHANLVRVYDLGEQDGAVFFTMPLVVGPNLADVIRRGPVAPRQAATWASQVGRALDHAHRAGFVHRDVKPGNILLEGGERPLLTDFGLVRQVANEEVPLTHDVQVIGTPAYMSPEQARGITNAIGPLSDQYALGVVLYEMLTGKRPFPDRNPSDVLRRILEEDPPSLADRGLPTPLVAICLRAMSREPADRYVDTGAFADDLDRFLRQEPVEAALPGLRARARHALRRQRHHLRRAALGLGAAVLGLGIYAVGARWFADRTEAAREVAAEERRALLSARIASLIGEGHHDEADAQFAAYASFDGNAETAALGAAWRDRGDVLRARGDAEGALDAYATAFAVAHDMAGERAALEALSRGYRERGDWDGLRAVVNTLGALGDGNAGPPRGEARDLALHEGDLEGARRLTDDPDESDLLRRLAQQTRTDHVAEQANLWDVDRDGRPEVLLSVETDPKVLLTDTTAPSLPVRGSLSGLGPVPYRDFFPLQTDPSGPPLALVNQNHSPIVAFRGDRLETVGSLNFYAPAATSADLDGDGVAEAYVAGSLALYRMDRSPDGAFHTAKVHPGTSQTTTQVWGLASADLNGDGQTELIAGTGAWGGYDVRVFRAAPEGLRIVTRRHVGEVTRLRLIRTPQGPAVVAFQGSDPNTPQNYQFFRKGALQGEAAGIHVLRLQDEKLQEVAQIPWSRHEVLPSASEVYQSVDTQSTLLTGDLNGDGLDEIVYGTGSGWLLVGLQHADGHFSTLEMSGVMPLAMAQVDDDPEQELLVATADTAHHLWVFGAGSDHLPPLTTPLATPRPAPVALGPELAPAWERAEALVSIGRFRSAADRFQTLADLATTAESSAEARIRAAEILEDRGLPAQAGPLYARVAEEPSLAAQAWEGALRCFLTDLRPELALQAAKARAALPSPPADLDATIARLNQQIATESTYFDFRQGIDPRWQVRSATGVRMDRAAGGLRLSAGEGEVLMDLPVQWSGAPIELQVAATPQRMDWGTSLSVGLVPVASAAGAADGGVRLYRIGGSGVLAEAFTCPSALEGFAVWDRPGTLSGRALRLTWNLDPVGSRGACTLEGSDGADGRRLYPTGQSGQKPGPMLLRVAGLGDIAGLTQALLQEITITGLTVRDVAPESASEANRALALDQPEQALAQIGAATDPRAQLQRALALDAEDRRAEAAAALKAALARAPELGGELHALLRTGLDRFEAPLRAVLGGRYFIALWQANEAFVTMHDQEPASDALMMGHLDGLESLDLAPSASDDDVDAVLEMLLHRAAAWRRAGQSGSALRDLARVEALSASLLRNTDHRSGDFLVNVGRVQAAEARERALVYLAQGDPSRAMDALLAGLVLSPAPEVSADLISANPAFDALHSQSRWAELMAARKVWP